MQEVFKAQAFDALPLTFKRRPVDVLMMTRRTRVVMLWRRGCSGIELHGALTVPVAAEIKIKLEEHKQHSLIGPLNH